MVRMTQVSLTTDEALQKAQQILNAEMINFDRWASQNPEKVSSNDIELRLMRQRIKVLRLQINELKQMQQDYQNTLWIAKAEQPLLMPNDPVLAQSRNNKIGVARENSRVAPNKITQKMSMG